MNQLALVKFLDTTTHDQWTAIEDTKEITCIPCCAVGWVIEENDTLIKLCALRNGEGTVSGVTITIPKRGCIIENLGRPDLQERTDQPNSSAGVL